MSGLSINLALGSLSGHVLICALLPTFVRRSVELHEEPEECEVECSGRNERVPARAARMAGRKAGLVGHDEEDSHDQRHDKLQDLQRGEVLLPPRRLQPRHSANEVVPVHQNVHKGVEQHATRRQSKV